MDGWMDGDRDGPSRHTGFYYIYCSQSVLLSIMILFLSHHFPTKINNCLFYYLDDSLINQLEKLEAAKSPKAALSVPSNPGLYLDLLGLTTPYQYFTGLIRPYWTLLKLTDLELLQFLF